MGRDKARLPLGDASLVERAAATMERVTSEVLIADRGRRLTASYRSVPDGSGRGPAAGILGAAQIRPGRDLLILACDLPAVPIGLLRLLAWMGTTDETAGCDACVPRWSRGIEPLCALYRPAALAALADEVAAGRFALHSLLCAGHLAVRTVEGEELAAFGSPEHLFLNINTPQDLARAKGDQLAGSAPRG